MQVEGRVDVPRRRSRAFIGGPAPDKMIKNESHGFP